jgi:hypothetical protein
MARPKRATYADAVTAERLIRVWGLRIQGWTEQMIADEYGVTQQSVSKWLRRAWEGRVDPSAAQLRAFELDKLDRVERIVLAVLDRRHPYVSAGRIVVDEDGEPLSDDGPVLAATDRLIRLSALRADIAGFKVPTKIDATVSQPTIEPAVAALVAAARERVERQKQQIIEGADE